MTGLVLKLRPKERVLINGAVIENGDRRSKFSVLTPDAKILRLRDALHPDEVTTPVRRVCYAAQLILTGDSKAEDTQLKLLRRIEELSQILTDGDSRAQLASATSALIDGQHYQCLKSLRSLLSREQRLLVARN
ncbi:flagellar biosynthesis repressor FlbT [Rhodobacteraceae bacterium Araon29]|tara:strand:+ start:1069 stop:1470 length:402 start_codon:yes stop_codon:yes gene_type:complete